MPSLSTHRLYPAHSCSLSLLLTSGLCSVFIMSLEPEQMQTAAAAGWLPADACGLLGGGLQPAESGRGVPVV